MFNAQDTWDELGFKLSAVEDKVLVRTHPMPEKIGLIYMPTKLTGFYGKLQGQYQQCYATVLSVPKDSVVKQGEIICFSRLAFANLYKMKDNTLVGFVSDNNIELAIESEENTL